MKKRQRQKSGRDEKPGLRIRQFYDTDPVATFVPSVDNDDNDDDDDAQNKTNSVLDDDNDDDDDVQSKSNLIFRFGGTPFRG